jgi:hypothetical protein
LRGQILRGNVFTSHICFLNPSRLTGALGFFLLSHNAIIRSS